MEKDPKKRLPDIADAVSLIGAPAAAEAASAPPLKPAKLP
jgi:hypothetical protein